MLFYYLWWLFFYVGSVGLRQQAGSHSGAVDCCGSEPAGEGLSKEPIDIEPPGQSPTIAGCQPAFIINGGFYERQPLSEA